MSGGIAVRANLLCVTWSAALGHVFLFDLEARQRVSAWSLPRGEAGFSDAAGVAIDEHFHLFVADPGASAVLRFSAFGRQLGSIGAGEPVRGDAGWDRPGRLERPHAVAVRGSTVFVAGGDLPRRHAVQRFTCSGRRLGSLRSLGEVEGKFGAPRALWADERGLLVADTLCGRVQRFSPEGSFVAALETGDRGELSRPVAVWRMADGDVFVVDRGDRPGLARFSVEGRRMPVPTDLLEHCEQPVALCADDRGRLYVLDRLGERVQRFTPDLSFDGEIVDLAEQALDFEARGPDV